MKIPGSVSEFPISRVASLTVLRGGSLHRFWGLNRVSVVEIRRRFDETFIGLRCLGVEGQFKKGRTKCNGNTKIHIYHL